MLLKVIRPSVLRWSRVPLIGAHVTPFGLPIGSYALPVFLPAVESHRRHTQTHIQPPLLRREHLISLDSLRVYHGRGFPARDNVLIIVTRERKRYRVVASLEAAGHVHRYRFPVLRSGHVQAALRRHAVDQFLPARLIAIRIHVQTILSSSGILINRSQVSPVRSIRADRRS